MLKFIVDESPSCFTKCAQVCGPMDEVARSGMLDKKAVTQKICASPKPFRCAYEVDECRAVIEMGKEIGVPQTEDALDAICSGTGHKDIQSTSVTRASAQVSALLALLVPLTVASAVFGWSR